MKENERYLDGAAADFTVGLLLWLDRSVVERELQKNHGTWRRDVSTSPLYHAMSLMTIGLIGFDAVAQGVARRLAPFGCKLLVYAPDAEAQACALAGCTQVLLDTLLAQSDAVSLHTTLPQGECLLGQAQLSSMKEGAWLINVTQASLIDEAALVAAIETRHLAGAALDVFWNEPLPADHPLIGLPNVILTPHIARAVEPEE